MARKEWTGEQFEEAVSKAAALAFHALTTDHQPFKQWYLEQIVVALGFDPEHFEKTTGHKYKRGIAP